jgi:tRNA A-37 threonylcarbamoyl transferase component Bud32
VTTPPPDPARPIEPPAAAPKPPRVAVGHYELLLELASGGMAMVYLGRAKDGRASAPLVAIKRPHRHLATDKNFLAMLLDEARLASAIAHENVVKVRELHFHEGEPFIVMDYVEGASLSEIRKELASSERAFDLKVALRIVLDALAGLHAAHELTDASGKPLGIVHRDISPHNILVGTDGRARLTDFGIAQATDRLQETRTQEVKGKLAYLAPERIDKRRMCTRQSDVFSMAIVLWECLAGRRLFRGEQALDTLQEVMHAPIPRLRQIGLGITPALDDVIAKALSRDLGVRFATALEFADALERAAGAGSLGHADQVAQLVEALYGPRIADRHAAVRAVLEDDATAERLFEDSGLPPRAASAATEPKAAIDVLRAIAPPAPSERYVFDAAPRDFLQVEGRRTRWAAVLGIAAGLIFGAGGALALAARSRTASPAVVTRASPPPRPPASARPWTAEDATPRAPTRHVIISLPFLASYVTVDGEGRDVSPASDVLTLDLPVDAPTTHRVVATALDGSLARADIREVDGVGRATGNGFVLLPRRASATTEAPSATRSVGAVSNGFTKLR